jgi:transcriptional regulator with XRE-family HTH domain
METERHSFRKRFGMRLRGVRLRAGATQQDLARAVGSAASCISQYEAGKRMPDLEAARRMADALGVTVDDLMPRDG